MSTQDCPERVAWCFYVELCWSPEPLLKSPVLLLGNDRHAQIKPAGAGRDPVPRKFTRAMNCNCRGVPIPAGSVFTVLRIWPQSGAVMSFCGRTSVCHTPRLLKKLRRTSPCCPLGGVTNAAG